MYAGSTICPQCFVDKGHAKTCPRCGYVVQGQLSPLILPHGTLLADQYLVGRVLGEPGGFGITYLAWDTRLETKVAVKEFMPRDLAVRDADQASVVPGVREQADLFYYGLERFLDEARTLAKFDHPNIVRVRTYFEQHRTGYIVMQYYDGIDLRSLTIQRGGRLAEKLAVDIMTPILSGLRVVHGRNFLHRDIKPSNIFITNKTIPILLDFGAARVALGDRSRSLSVILTEGFAPYEQYYSKGKQGPWTDIYACGATLYYLVSGVMPVPAVERAGEDGLIPIQRLVSELSQPFCRAVSKALAFRPEDRPRRVDDFLSLLQGTEKRREHRGENRKNGGPETRIVRCPHCQAKNRIPAGSLAKTVFCGRCQRPLVAKNKDAYLTAEARLVRCRHCGAKNKVRQPSSPETERIHRCGRCNHRLE